MNRGGLDPWLTFSPASRCLSCSQLPLGTQGLFLLAPHTGTALPSVLRRAQVWGGVELCDARRSLLACSW